MMADFIYNMCGAHTGNRLSRYFPHGNGGKRKYAACIYAAFLSLFLSMQSAAAQKRFFNLTAGEVKIDSVLPRFSYSVPLGGNYADSTYEVRIKYPEFIDMGKGDIQKYLNITRDSLPVLPEIETQIVVERKKGKLELSFVPLVNRNGKYQILVSFMIEVTSNPLRQTVLKARSRTAAAEPPRYADHSVLASGRWAKIRIPENGVYQLTGDLARRAGFPDLSRVKIYGYGGNLQNEELVGTELAELDDLKEVPTCTVNGRRLFYGRGPVSWSSNTASRRTRNPYSSYGYYFLTESDGEPLSVDSTEFLSSFYPSADDYHSLHEIDNFAWYRCGRNLFENSPVSSGSSKSYTLANSQNSAARRVTVAVTAGAAGTAQIEINGEVLGTMSFSLGTYDEGCEVERTYYVEGERAADEVKITCLSGGPLRLDYISVAYDKPRPAPSLARGTFAEPEYVYGITNQDHHADGPADFVIIIPASQKLLAQAQRLADYHAVNDGMRVRIVPADELYNEFSSGTPDANAYRRYMKMLYDRAEDEADMPKSLLLFGDCVWDNRMLTADCSRLNPDDYLLAFESENSFSHTQSYVDDGFFTLLDDGEGLNPQGSDKQDIGVGRFPVTGESDAKTMVDKSISYMENKNAGDWQNVLMFMGDDGDNDLHMKDVNKAADTVADNYPGFLIKKVMWDAYSRESSSTGNSYPEVERLIKQQQAAGALVMDYGGHGSETALSHEYVLRLNDFKEFTNTNLPLWITAACDIMPFDSNSDNIGEAAVLNSKGGALAFFGTTRTVYASYNAAINTSFLKHVLSVRDGRPVTLGEAQRLAKNEMITTGQDKTQNKLQYALLGNPAMSLNLPAMQVVIDSINGMELASGGIPVLKAGSVVTVKGHIENNSVKAADFNGRITATVLDTQELITCKRNNANEADGFQFYDRQKTLYNGSDNVSGGSFSFVFAVPRDINYADGTGRITVYAVNDDHSLQANGSEDRFYVNGSEEVFNDSIGPSIYCYLNSPDFVNGGTVNATPYFVAEITDKDGINASGNGIGHDMQLIIDGDMSKTYNLNGNFSYAFGTYTSGSTYYSIPELTEGQHTLKFRAWDMMNNSNAAVLSFNVVKGLVPELVDISCTENPARTSTTFIASHNFAGSNVDVAVDVFDMSGRLLWSRQASGVSSTNTYTVDWDLTLDSGARLQTGVYLYRVRLGSGGSAKASKAKKLIVLSNN